jgi:predicted TIM-barrel fold metal-dependent hydrolase
MVVDCEAHVFESIVMPGGAEFHGCQVERLLQDMDRCGVDKSILHAYNTRRLSAPGSQFPDPDQESFGRDPLQYFFEAWQAHQDRLYWFSVPDPRQPDCIDVLQEELRCGLQGIGETQPGYQYLMPDSPEYMGVWRLAADRGLPVVITAEGWDQFSGYYPSADWDAYWDMYEGVIRQFPGTRWMIGHAGNCGSIVGTKSWDDYLQGSLRCYRLAAELDNVWICSCMPWWISRDQVNPLLPKLLDYLREHVGFGRVTWGSDWPWAVADISFCSRYETVVDVFREFPCSAEEKALLLGEAAHEFVTGRAVAAASGSSS